MNKESHTKFITHWLASTIVLYFLMAMWSIATPLGASSDEPVQIIKAAAVAQGEFLGQPTPPGTTADKRHDGRAVMTVVVPLAFAGDASLAGCFRHHPNQTAKCARPLGTSGRLTTATTYVGRYPPLYYAIVGLPSLIWHSSAAVYWMRLLSSLASALLLALVFASALRWSQSRLLIAGVALVVTPMVLFLGSVVTPSGLEISAAIASWTTGLILVVDQSIDPPRALVAAFAGSCCVLTLSRGLSPLWVALIVVTLVVLEPVNRALRI